MKTIKPQKLSVLHRVFEHRGRKLFVPTVIVTFPLDDPAVLLHEVVLWKTVAADLDESTPLDEMMFKPHAEALLSGTAYPPGKAPAVTCSARMQVGAVDKSIIVVGDRHWTTLGPSKPAILSSMPLQWERAFGGQSFAPNPVGLGAEPITVDGKKRQPLPNLEVPGALITSPSDKPTPAGFGAFPFHWPQRQRLAGSYDANWRKNRFPGFPDDIDLAMFNVAPPDQHFAGYLEGGESFVLENVHPERSRIEGRLPTHRARCFVTRTGYAGDGVPPLEEITLKRDTIHFFPSVGCGVLFFRGILPIEQDDAADLLHLVAAVEAADQPKPVEHYQSALARRLDRETGGFAALKDSDLLPPVQQGREPLAIEKFGDMTDLLATEGLLDKNQRRRAQAYLDKGRQACLDEGVDPDEHFPVALAPAQPPPDLADLESVVERIKAQRDAAVLEAEAMRDKLEATAKTAFAEAGIGDELTQGGGGPPTFSAEVQIDSLRQRVALMRIAGQPTNELEAMLLDDDWLDQLKQTEAGIVRAYQRFAHYYPAASGVGERAQVLRAEVERAHQAGESLARRDLTGADLSGLDLRGVDLAGAFLEKADLTDTILDGSKLDQAVLTRAMLHRTQIRGAKLTGTNFGDAELIDVTLEGSDCQRAVFGKAHLTRVCLADAVLDGVDFLQASFLETTFAGARGRRILFLRLDLSHTDFSSSELIECVFVQSQFDGARFDKATLNGTIFVGCEARQASFDNAHAHNLRICKDSDFSSSSFVGAKLDGAAFRSTNFENSDFSDASLKGADLSACDLQGAKLCRVVAPRVMMMKTDLRQAVVTQANLMEGILQKANIRGTDFRGSNLFRVDFARIEGDDSTRFDGALRKHVRFVRPEGGMGS